MIGAEVICDSISPAGKRLTTFKLRYPKFIHGEFMTHRVISRNASSSRAVPTAKLLEEVRSDALRAAPVFWGKNQPGMQAAEELSDTDSVTHAGHSRRSWAQILWRDAALGAADLAEDLSNLGAHKQIVNRLLEPFSHINVVATATEWDNFFGLRLHAAAQPEMRALAEAMWAARAASEPRLCQPGANWHLPFFKPEDWDAISEYAERTDQFDAFMMHDGLGGSWGKEHAIAVSVARCARVSYESHETGRRSTVEEDLALADRLRASGHWSPFEHQATPDEALLTFSEGASGYSVGINHSIGFKFPEQHGNFVGWRQHRKLLPGEAVAPLPEGY